MKWKTKDGRLIEVRDMTDSHLLNTILFIRRGAERMADQTSIMDIPFPCFQGEEAQAYAEEQFFSLMENGVEPADCIPPIYHEMIREARNRRLDVPRWENGDRFFCIEDEYPEVYL